MTTSGVAPSPSGIPLRPLGAAEVLDGAVRIVRHHPRAAFGLAVPIAFVQAVLTALLLYSTYASSDLSTLRQLGQLFVSAALSLMLSGLLAPVVVADVLGTSITGREALRRSRAGRGVLLLAVLGVLVGLAQTVGVVLAVVGGVWLWGIWAVAGPAMTVEGLGPIAAVKRSFGLVKSQFWRTWGVRALGWLVTTVLGLLITLPFDTLAAYLGNVDFLQTSGGITRPGLFVVVMALGQLLSVALVAPVGAAVDGLIYTDLRMRVEGMDLVVGDRPLERTDAVPVSAW